MFAHRIEFSVGWGDCDPAGTVFHPRVFAMLDEATAALLEAASGMKRQALIHYHGIIGWPMMDARAVFHSIITFDDRVGIETEVTKIEDARFDLAHRIAKDDKICVEAVETRMWASPYSNGTVFKACHIPEGLQLKLLQDVRS